MESINLYFFGSMFSISLIIAMLLFASFAFHLEKYLCLKGIKYFIYPFSLYLLLLLFVSLININSFSSRFFDTALVSNVLMFVLLLNYFYRYPHVKDKAIFMFYIGAVFLAVLSFMGVGVEYYSNGRLTWLGTGPTELALKICIAISIALAMLFRKGFRLQIKTLWLILSILLLLWVVIETGSRTALIIVSLIFAASFFLMKKNMKGTILLILIVASLVIYYFQSEVMQERVDYTLTQEISTEDPNNDVLGGRLYLWSNMIKIFFENNIFIGNGLSGLDEKLYKKFGTIINTHNVFLEVLLKTGIIGIMFYLLFISRLINSSYRIYKHNGNYLYILLLISIAGYVFFLHANVEKIFWLIAAFISSSYITLNKRKINGAVKSG